MMAMMLMLMMVMVMRRVSSLVKEATAMCTRL